MRISDPDVETWLGYVARVEAEFLEHAGFGAQYWLESWTGSGDFERVMTGPWHVLRRHVTTELREWFDEYFVERVTITEWRARCRAERQAERHAYLEWLAEQPF